ncbi:MAG TPA: MarR family transcriptional regulator [Candidatus Omnitrophota bacterium]|nr:MarR family transcriptional regulator [Candidatus Omnitrophota bacterium]
MTGQNLKKFTTELSSLMPSIMRGVLKRQSDEIMSGQITMPQFIVLELIKDRGELKMTEIASKMSITLPAATGLIDRLHSMDMIDRVYDKSDRRIIRIVATPKGKSLVNRIIKKRMKSVKNIFGKLSEAERQNYLKILRKVHDVIYKAN